MTSEKKGEKVDKKEGGEWEITVFIPKKCIERHQNLLKVGTKMRANFYKIGDNHKD